MVVLQQVHGRLASIFMHHGACRLSPPLLSVKGPLFSEADYVAQFMDRNGTIVVLPSDHRVCCLCHGDVIGIERDASRPPRINIERSIFSKHSTKSRFSTVHNIGHGHSGIRCKVKNPPHAIWNLGGNECDIGDAMKMQTAVVDRVPM